jgi:MFS family permease
MTETAAATPALRMSTAHGRWVVAATVLGSGMAALDATVVGIALPAIGRDFHVGIASLQWVVNAYTLTLAGLLLLGGTLGDSYGRRKVFVIGVVWFAAASLLCGLAPTAGVLIAARALQGVGGALAGITYGLIAASADGWTSVSVLLPLAAGLVLLGVFILVEAREPEPMLPLGIFRSRQFSAANAVTFVVYAALGGLLFLVPTVLIVAHGYSPVAAGTALLPVTFIMLALSSRSGALAARIGPRLQMSVGPVVIAASLLLFARISDSGNYLTAVNSGGIGSAFEAIHSNATQIQAWEEFYFSCHL